MIHCWHSRGAGIAAAIIASTAAACAPAAPRSRPGHTAEAAPPGFTLDRRGDAHDFDYFEGAWTTAQRRLKERGVGSTDWEEFPATLCATPYLDGLATVDELLMPTRGQAGLTVRLFDRARQQWAIYWVNSATGRLDPAPVRGGFAANRGEFYATDQHAGRPVKVRYVWTKLDADHARWEQAFSFDDRTWETNWTAEFTRADPSVICDRGRARR